MHSKRLALSLVLFFIFNAITARAVVFGYDRVLLWMVDDTAKVHCSDGSIRQITEFVPSDEGSSLAARVRVTGGNINKDTFLSLYVDDGGSCSGDMGSDFGDFGSGYWGCGVPVGNQSPITDFARSEFNFIIELGHYSYDESNDTESWTTIASSDSYSYDSLTGYTYQTFDVSPPDYDVWNPHDFYIVPEPKSCLLMLIGTTIMLLRGVRCRYR